MTLNLPLSKRLPASVPQWVEREVARLESELRTLKSTRKAPEGRVVIEPYDEQIGLLSDTLIRFKLHPEDEPPVRRDRWIDAAIVREERGDQPCRLRLRASGSMAFLPEVSNSVMVELVP